ncbi:sugar phosphate isomerase/epimerase family protein [Streptosporangium sp. CA-135522]|uniref:sugar phosphate isomerase/epimerase family protein n=1 Tax=Streptosporangium sp. CA-135522 TaxID=3240072 RepID=UPI003D8E3557
MTLQAAPFAERVHAAATAGFDSIGLTLEQYRDARRAGFDDAAMRDLLTEHGVRVAEVETRWDWAAGEADTQAAEEGELLFQVLDAFGCRRFNAMQFVPHPKDELVGRFAALCRRAAARQVTVALEFMPFSELRTLAQAWEVIAAAGEPNAGILLDSWHYHRSGGSPDLLTSIPADRIVSVQLNDALPEPDADPRHEARHLRLLPGEGSIALTDLLALLRDHGVRAPMSAEVWSDALEALPPATAASRVFEATRRVLERAGWPSLTTTATTSA